jgi:hypothetical protein
MKLIPALEYEKLRQDKESWNKIIVHREGKFYHIYEWSAWLVKTVACTEDFQRQRGDTKMLAANRYNGKDYEYVMIGFPLESLSKYVPEYINLETMEGGDLAITVDIPLNGDETIETMQNAFEQWKRQCPLLEKKAKGNKDITSGSSQASQLVRSGIFNILSEVLSYPVERMTPAENIDFISNIKQKVAALL